MAAFVIRKMTKIKIALLITTINMISVSFESHLSVQIRVISKLTFFKYKSHLDVEINLPITVLQNWHEADGRVDKPMTTSNNREYPVLRSSQEILAIIKRLQMRIL